MKAQVAIACVMIALFLDSLSYYRQVSKTVRAKHSSQVSAMAFIFKIAKVMFSTTGLVLYSNFVGLGMELFMLTVYIVSLSIIIKYKPKGWKLWS